MEEEKGWKERKSGICMRLHSRDDDCVLQGRSTKWIQLKQKSKECDSERTMKEETRKYGLTVEEREREKENGKSNGLNKSTKSLVRNECGRNCTNDRWSVHTGWAELVAQVDCGYPNNKEVDTRDRTGVGEHTRFVLNQKQLLKLYLVL